MLRSKLLKRSFSAFCALALTAFFAVGVSAQSGTTSINGVITDQNGAAVPGASVKLTNPDTGFSRTVVTNDDGA
jgi:hypothetical protein